jgi:hypothetical protein
MPDEMPTEELARKASACAHIARHMLRGRTYETEEDMTEHLERFAVGLMYIPDAALRFMHDHLLADEPEDTAPQTIAIRTAWERISSEDE